MSNPKRSPQTGLYLFVGLGIALSIAVRSCPDVDLFVSKLIFGLVLGALILMSFRRVMKRQSRNEAVFREAVSGSQDPIQPVRKLSLGAASWFVSFGILLTSGFMFLSSVLAILISVRKFDAGTWFGVIGLVFFGLCTLFSAKRIRSI